MMKKSEKADILSIAIENKRLCTCSFTCSDKQSYFYPLAFSDKIIVVQIVEDFQINGYEIIQFKHIKRISFADNKYDEINEFAGIKNQIGTGEIDISCFCAFFESLKLLNKYVIIENEPDDLFIIGRIEKVLKSKLWIRGFDANGIWDEEVTEIPYSSITSVRWDDRYSSTWQTYLERR